MNTQDLRLGNIVWDGEAELVITGINADNLYARRKTGTRSSRHDVDALSGVKLTEEVMLAAGFEKRESAFASPMFGTRRFHFCEDSAGCYYIIFNMYFSVTVRYLHELQNLIFSLVGEELVYPAKKEDGR